VAGCSGVGFDANGDANGSHGSVLSPMYNSEETSVSNHASKMETALDVPYKVAISLDTLSGNGGTFAKTSSLRLFVLTRRWSNKASAFG
jgi:hypothetical protein